MKKFKILCALLITLGLVSACGSDEKQTKTCDYTYQYVQMNVKMTASGDEITKINMDMTVKVSDMLSASGVTQEQWDSLSQADKDQAFKQFEDSVTNQYKNLKGVTVETKTTDDELKATLKIDLDKADDAALSALNLSKDGDYYSLDKSVEEFENLGGKCK